MRRPPELKVIEMDILNPAVQPRGNNPDPTVATDRYKGLRAATSRDGRIVFFADKALTGVLKENSFALREPKPEEVESPPEPTPLIPESDHSPLQRSIDQSGIRALAGGLLVNHFPDSGETEVAGRYYAPSRTRLEAVHEEGETECWVIAGGWITREEAQLEMLEQVAGEVPPETLQERVA